jgi:site-specific DNA-methyltransferase (adenine-specific)
VTLHVGDCRDVLAQLPANSVDSIVTDPPYHLTSIVRRFGAEGAAEARPGATGAYQRASAGFMGKQWDGGDIAFTPVVWAACLRVLKPGGYILAFASSRGFARMSVAIEDAGFITHPLIAWVFGSGFPKATRVRAEGYDDFRYGGQALKPAIEPIYMGQKPFERGLSGTENILRWGTGALNIGGTRIGTRIGTRTESTGEVVSKNGSMSGGNYGRVSTGEVTIGRWPANLIHDGSEEVLRAFPDAGGQNGAVTGDEPMEPRGDSGSAARFFYQAKATAEDRLGSRHPTVKPLALMQYLTRLATPPRGVVLDPFAGTGTTGEAAWREGMSAVLIEREPDYLADIATRMDLADKPGKRAAVAKAKGDLQAPDGVPLFAGTTQ